MPNVQDIARDLSGILNKLEQLLHIADNYRRTPDPSKETLAALTLTSPLAADVRTLWDAEQQIQLVLQHAQMLVRQLQP